MWIKVVVDESLCRSMKERIQLEPSLCVQFCVFYILGGSKRGWERIRVDEPSWWSQHCDYLLFTPHSVLNPERTCEAVRQRVTSYPLRSILSSLCRYFGNSCGSSKINPQPLVDVIRLYTPGSYPTWSSCQVYTGERGGTNSAVNSWGSQGTVWNSTIFDPKWHGTLRA